MHRSPGFEPPEPSSDVRPAERSTAIKGSQQSGCCGVCQLSYDDPLSKFMTSFPEEESAKRSRIKHLLSHTSGLPMGVARPPDVSPKTVDDFLAAISEPPRLQFEPGTAFQYSNMGFIVLGKVIEKVAHRAVWRGCFCSRELVRT
jgi:hypothetical protein